MKKPFSVSGWDIGGANIKAVRLDRDPEGRETIRAVSRSFAMWQDSAQLETALMELGRELDLPSTKALGLTMTAELADAFRTKSQGVAFVCGAVKRVFPETLIMAMDLANSGWSPIGDADFRPLDFAANNWLASALYVAPLHRDCLLMDIGSTTTDIIPIKNGLVLAKGRTDTDRLIHGELVYTGILRTNPDTVAPTIPVNGLPCRVASEWFSSMADVHLLLGHISGEEYSCATADGRDRTPEDAAQRLARVVCADSETLCHAKILAMARYLYERQLNQVAEALHQVLSTRGEPEPPTLLATGGGAFMIRELGRRLGMETTAPLPHSDPEALAVLPALAAASLLADHISESS